MNGVPAWNVTLRSETGTVQTVTAYGLTAERAGESARLDQQLVTRKRFTVVSVTPAD